MAALPREIEEKLDQVRALCVKYGVKKLTLFGSAARGEYDPATSDVDFLIELPENMPTLDRGRALWRMMRELDELFGIYVDLLDLERVENPYLRRSIENNPRIAIYEAA